MEKIDITTFQSLFQLGAALSVILIGIEFHISSTYLNSAAAMRMVRECTLDLACATTHIKDFSEIEPILNVYGEFMTALKTFSDIRQEELDPCRQNRIYHAAAIALFSVLVLALITIIGPYKIFIENIFVTILLAVGLCVNVIPIAIILSHYERSAYIYTKIIPDLYRLEIKLKEMKSLYGSI